MAENDQNDFKNNLNKIFEDEEKSRQQIANAQTEEEKATNAFLNIYLEAFKDIQQALNEKVTALITDDSKTKHSISLIFEDVHEKYSYTVEVRTGKKLGYRLIQQVTKDGVEGDPLKTHSDDSEQLYGMGTVKDKEGVKNIFLTDFKNRHARQLKFQYK
ncbi:MAG: hypothetical protein JSS82_02520 [Bacteroidetes bacterium]|nr:hypothetical protein [Bacteroidota bacterium]